MMNVAALDLTIGDGLVVLAFNLLPLAVGLAVGYWLGKRRGAAASATNKA